MFPQHSANQIKHQKSDLPLRLVTMPLDVTKFPRTHADQTFVQLTAHMVRSTLSFSLLVMCPPNILSPKRKIVLGVLSSKFWQCILQASYHPKGKVCLQCCPVYLNCNMWVLIMNCNCSWTPNKEDFGNDPIVLCTTHNKTTVQYQYFINAKCMHPECEWEWSH